MKNKEVKTGYDEEIVYKDITLLVTVAINDMLHATLKQKL